MAVLAGERSDLALALGVDEVGMFDFAFACSLRS
jgi:hypothetical protein